MVFFDNEKRILNPPSSCKDDGKRMQNKYYSNMIIEKLTLIGFIWLSDRPIDALL
jgi:hypothetical protein